MSSSFSFQIKAQIPIKTKRSFGFHIYIYIYVYSRGNHNVKGAPLKESIRTFFGIEDEILQKCSKHYSFKKSVRGTFDCHVRVTQLAKLGEIYLFEISGSWFSILIFQKHTPRNGVWNQPWEFGRCEYETLSSHLKSLSLSRLLQ